MMMEFEELQKIWDAQTSQPLYAINEQALHNRILSKKKQAWHITNFTELMLIIVHFGAAIFVAVISLLKPPGNVFMYVMAAWMFATAVYTLAGRIRRIKGDQRFDRSIHGDLSHAVSIASYQVRLSGIMRWNMLPIGALMLLAAWEGGKLIWVTGLAAMLFLLAFYAAKWEHNLYKSRKRELEILQQKLERLDG